MANDHLQLDETSRLAALEHYQILDTPAEQLFDDFTQLAAQICGTPISLISLVDDRRQWFKAKLGLDVCETPRELAFCAHAIADGDEVLVVPNATQDERFVDNALVTGEPRIRFYAGAPLVTPAGEAIGTLCVIDRQPRILTDQQIQSLKILAGQVVSQLEARLNLRRLDDTARDLEFQRSEMQLILDHVPAYVFFKDTENNILRVNRAVCKALGTDDASVEGRSTAEIYPDHAEEFYQDDLEVIRSKKPKLGTVERLSADRMGLRWIRTDKFPIANQLGEIERLLVVASDITDLKNTEDSLRASQALLRQTNAHLEERVEQQTAELRASQHRYEDLYQNAPDMHLSVSPEDSRIIQCNQTMLSELGYTREELVGQPVQMTHHPSCRGNQRAIMETFLTTGRVRDFELTLVRKDGTSLEVSLNVSAIRDADGKIIASRSVCRDISEQKRLEAEARRHMDQLAHLSRVATINEMATGIAHELNQPLHAIKNYAQGALMRLRKQSIDSTALAPIFANIVADADRAAELILSFRRYIQPSARELASVRPAEMVSRVVKLIGRELEQHRSPVSVVALDSLPAVHCDAVQIEQVLINLTLNSAEAVSESLAVDREIKIIVERTERQTVRFAVVDGGIGAIDMDRLFDAFYTTKNLGLGMGLPICRTIIESHGGSLTATRNQGPGMTLSFELPIRVAES